MIKKLKKTKVKETKKQKPLSLNMSFDEAMQRLLRVKPKRKAR